MLASALETYDRTAARLEARVAPDILAALRQFKSRTELTLLPRLGDGHSHPVQAFIVRHSDALGPSKGGIRVTANVSLNDVSALAMEMTWKCALIGAPFGGGKSGVVADARALAPIDKETLMRSFARNATHLIDPHVYVPAPDMGTSETDMGHIKDAISYGHGKATTGGCYVTGKPVILGGIPGRREATGRGVAILIEAALRGIGSDVEGARVAIQGFGNVGSVAARRLSELGARIVAIADIDGGVVNPDGLDLDGLDAHVLEAGTVEGFTGGARLASAEVLEVDCDVLIPAASGDQIVADNCERVRARLVAEAANGPTSPEADRRLNARGVAILPDILCNAGGVFVSYLEYAQETQSEQMEVAEVEARLQQRMTQRFALVAELAASRNLTWREAAMDIAVERVAAALAAKGALP